MPGWGQVKFMIHPRTWGRVFRIKTVSESERYCVEVNMSMQRKFASRAIRVATVSGIALFALAPTAAHADCYPNDCTNDPGDPGATTTVQGATASKSSTLPLTGGDATGLAVIGVGAVAAGAVFVRQSRRRAVA